MSNDDWEINIIVPNPTPAAPFEAGDQLSGVRGAGTRGRLSSVVGSKFGADLLSMVQNVGTLLGGVDGLALQHADKYQLSELKLNLGIEASGKLGLICAESSASGSVAIELTFSLRER